MSEKHPEREPNKGGRPKKLTGLKSKTVGFAVSEEAYKDIQKKAEELKISVSEYCFKMVTSGQVVDVYSNVTKKDRATLYGLANNINQLAYKANVGNFEGIRESLDDTIAKIYNVLDKYYESITW